MSGWGRKDPDCPNCGGRSYDASGSHGDYVECNLCEVPTERYHDFYRERWPKQYKRWSRTAPGRAARKELAA